METGGKVAVTRRERPQWGMAGEKAEERQQPGHEGCLGSSMGCGQRLPFALQCLLRVDSGASLPGLQSRHWPPQEERAGTGTPLSVLPFHHL